MYNVKRRSVQTVNSILQYYENARIKAYGVALIAFFTYAYINPAYYMPLKLLPYWL